MERKEDILNLNEAMIERRYFESGRLTAEQTLSLFRSVFDSESGQQVLAELMRRWHFFDPVLETKSAVEKRRCIMELLILCGMWHPSGMDSMVAATTNPAKPGWIGRMLGTLRTIKTRKEPNA